MIETIIWLVVVAYASYVLGYDIGRSHGAKLMRSILEKNKGRNKE